MEEEDGENKEMESNQETFLQGAANEKRNIVNDVILIHQMF